MSALLAVVAKCLAGATAVTAAGDTAHGGASGVVDIMLAVAEVVHLVTVLGSAAAEGLGAGSKFDVHKISLSCWRWHVKSLMIEAGERWIRTTMAG
jgi:hypothetical protein